MSNSGVRQLKRNNTNIYVMEGRDQPLFKALRKTRGKKSDMSNLEMPLRIELMALINPTSYDPFPSVDIALDIQTFAKTLPEELREVFQLFISGVPPKQIVEITEMHYRKVYRAISDIKTRFSAFYLEEV